MDLDEGEVAQCPPVARQQHGDRAAAGQQQVFLAADLTLEKEEIVRDTVEEVYKKVQNKKKEFILIIDKPTKRI